MLEKIVLPVERLVLKSLGVNFVSMDYVDQILVEMVEMIRDDRMNFRPEMIIGIKRAGVYAAKKIAEGLHLPEDFIEANRNFKYLGSLSLNDRFMIGKILGTYTTQDPHLRDSTLRKKLPGKILLVDDDCGSGKTFNLVKDHLMSKGAEDIKTACVFSYDGCFSADYVGLRVPRLNNLMKGSCRLPWNDVSPHNGEYSKRLMALGV